MILTPKITARLLIVGLLAVPLQLTFFSQVELTPGPGRGFAAAPHVKTLRSHLPDSRFPSRQICC